MRRARAETHPAAAGGFAAAVAAGPDRAAGQPHAKRRPGAHSDLCPLPRQPLSPRPVTTRLVAYLITYLWLEQGVPN